MILINLPPDDTLEKTITYKQLVTKYEHGCVSVFNYQKRIRTFTLLSRSVLTDLEGMERFNGTGRC